ncbi:ABC transporter permease [Bacillus sp. ISL-40]|uniref:ABC transporter permease n=1 Tax=unclassified Bacillus (in: firmicutes) TaxID=185979 RepID=UPI001BEAD09C|nr:MULTISPECIES: ABC transporter permease [unclassified Bacillus (in: firmicutes)]MBT2695847.1 ABC transporter permease [Bacillus sp. ISL-40]MBT2724460.1 ABC transporter permease [Bacillus sp. ISL-46]MBT2743673.1 ABC transporter permease [Bacillus sp. ISL-77]
MTHRRVPYIILAPGLILLILFLVVPLISIVFPTFFNGGFTLANYTSFFMDEYNLGIFWRTIKISLIVTLICVLLGVPTAYYISQSPKKSRSLLMALTLFPLLTNSVVRSFAWITLLGQNGIINNTLMNAGLISKPLTLLYTEFAIGIGSVYLFLPLMVITLVGILENIDSEIMEAAETLGANRLIAFMKVILPLSVPGIIVGSILVFTGTMTAYTTPQLLGGNRNIMLATFLYQNATALGNWQGASVIALIMIVATVIVMKLFYWVAGRMDKRGETSA